MTGYVVLALTTFVLGLTLYTAQINIQRWKARVDPLSWACALIGVGFSLVLLLAVDFIYAQRTHIHMSGRLWVYMAAMVSISVGYIEIVRFRIRERQK